MGLIDLWQQAQPAIRGRVGDSSYETWFSALHITALPPQTIVIETPDEFFKNWIIDNYQTIIIAGIMEMTTRMKEGMQSILQMQERNGIV